MNILHLATTYPLHEADSSAAFVESLVEATCRRGHEVHVLLPYHPELALQRPNRKARLHSFRTTPLKRWHPWGYAQALTADRALRWDAYAATPFAVVSAARAVRRILRTTPIDIVHADWLVPAGPIVAWALRDQKQQMVISCHGSGVFLAEKRGWAASAAKWSAQRAAAITACSNDLTRRAAHITGRDDAQWIPYGVEVERFRPLDPETRADKRQAFGASFGASPDNPWVLAVGRLVYKKGFENLVRSLAVTRRSVPGAELIVVGDGPLRRELQQAATEVGVADAVHLVGALPHADIADLYAAADVIAVPSVHGPGGNVDGLPNVFLEGLASGTAVVASRIAGIPDIGRDGDTVALVAEGDIEELGTTTATILADESRRAALGAAARADAEARLGWDHVAARFEGVYEEISRS